MSPNSSATTGRLSRLPHPVLLELLYEPHLAADRDHVLPYLLRIDAAHLVMLTHCALLPRVTAGALLRTNRELEASRVAGDRLFDGGGAHRGLYALYEGELIARLGPEVGGAAHLARSRNDINATVPRMRLREALVDLFDHLHSLLNILCATAARHTSTLTCAFTHQQPAQPTSFGHYLTAALAELVRCAEWLDHSWDLTDHCPLGSAAGFGTSMPTDPALVAKLLGFSQVVSNSLDGVASRDYLVHCLGGLAMLGVSLTRSASDLQTWAGEPYRFIDWPDDLVSTSSIMPQKRNPYVLENIRGRAVQPVGDLMNTLIGLKNVPLSNSVEVSGEAAHHIWSGLAGTSQAVRLIALLLEHMVVDQEAMSAFLKGKQTTMTALANLLVTHRGIAFRTAHGAVGQLVSEGLSADGDAHQIQPRLQGILRDLGYEGEPLGAEEIARALDPQRVMQESSSGGGPSPDSVRRQLEGLRRGIDRLEASAPQTRRCLEEGDERLHGAVQALMIDSGAAGG